MPKKVFISYAREDLETAKKLFRDLQTAGFEPWLDDEDLLAGQNWRETITREIRKTDYALILMSNRSVVKRGFVQVEQIRALEVLETLPPQDIFLIPVRLEDCEIPDRLGQGNWVDLFSDYEAGLSKVIVSLNAPRVSDGPSAPEPPKTVASEPPLIYISYATIDNHSGWVDTLVSHLTTELAQRIGSRDLFSVFLDRNADSETPNLPPEVMAQIEKAAVFIPVVSPSYVLSDRCKRELNTFVRSMGGRENAHIRVVERLKSDDEKRPGPLANLRASCRLWQQAEGQRAPRILGHPVPNPDRDDLYFQRVFDLSVELAEMIQCFEPETAPIQCAETTTDSLPPVYLADVTEDLLDLRDELERYLDESGFRVLPEREIPSADLETYQAAVAASLAECRVFVQLLSGQAGKTRTLRDGVCRLQFEAAEKAGKVVLQWRSPDSKLDDVSDQGQKELLSGTSVQSVAMSEFRGQVVKRARFKPPKADASPSVSISSGALVFLNAEKRDKPHAEQVAELMKQREVACAFPVWEKDEPDLLKDMEDFILNSDGFIVIYGNVQNTWVRKQLLYCRNLIYRREEPLKAMAIYEGPPPGKPAINFTIPGLTVIRCRDCLDEREFEPFFEALANGGPS